MLFIFSFFFFLVTPCLVVAVLPYMEKILIKKVGLWPAIQLAKTKVNRVIKFRQGPKLKSAKKNSLTDKFSFKKRDTPNCFISFKIEIFLKVLTKTSFPYGIIVARGVLTTLFYEEPPILPNPPFQILSNPPPSFCVASNPQRPLFFLLSCFFGWMSDCTTVMCYFAVLMILWIYTCQVLVPKYQKDLDVCFMQQGIKCIEVWHLMWFFAGTLIWYHKNTYTQTQRHTVHSGASRLTHPYKYIFTPPFMCSQQLSLLHWMSNSLISKIYFPQCLFFSKIIHL